MAFESDGRQIGWAAPQLLEGETINPTALKRILENIIEEINIIRTNQSKPPVKRLGLLRDGRFYELISVINEVESEYGVEIDVFEVRKSGAPRLAQRFGTDIVPCEVGTAIWKGEWGFLQPNKARSNMGSPVILQVHTIKSAQKMPDILHDIYWLSKMHLGTTMQPGLPVPIHYADRLSKYAGLGVIRNPDFTTNLDFL